MELNMSDSIKENCVKLVNLINNLDYSNVKLNKSRSNRKPTGLFSMFGNVGQAMADISSSSGNFCIHWNEGDNIVIIEKNNHINYLITLNPGKTLFKVDNYSLDFKKATIDVLKTGPWMERFEKYVEKRIKEVDLLIETEKRMEHDSKFGEVDF